MIRYDIARSMRIANITCSACCSSAFQSGNINIMLHLRFSNILTGHLSKSFCVYMLVDLNNALNGPYHIEHHIALCEVRYFVNVLYVSAAPLPPSSAALQSNRLGSNNNDPPAPVSAWSKAVPPKDNGRVGYGPGVATGAWERDA